MNPVSWVRRRLYRLGLLIDYGPTLTKLGIKAYRKVEEMLGDHAVQPDVERRRIRKQVMFRDYIKADRITWKRAMGYTPLDREVNAFREKVWVLENWGKAGREGCQTG